MGLTEGWEFVEEFAEEGFGVVIFAVAAVVGGEVAAGDAGGVRGVGSGGFFDVFRERREKADDMAEPLLFVWLGHADDGAESVRAGIVAGISGAAGEDDRDAASGFDVAAEVIAWIAFAFDFCDEKGRREEVENFASAGGVADGDDVVAFVFEVELQGFAELVVGIYREDHGFF